MSRKSGGMHGGSRPGSGQPRKWTDPVKATFRIERDVLNEIARSAERMGVSRNEIVNQRLQKR